jgi:ceramide glucosyltransferase
MSINLYFFGKILLYLVCFSLYIVAIFYYVFSLDSARDFSLNINQAQEQNNSNYNPPVSILKPLCGLEANSYVNLGSFVKQNYPQYQVIFCVKESTDPIIKVVEQIIKDFPSYDLSLVVNNRLIGTNFKISNLANGLDCAKHEILVLADSDIRVDDNYLQTIIQRLQDEKVGVVTCLYKSKSEGLMAIFEGIGVACDFFPSVLTARKLEGIKFAFGSTIVIRKKVLDELGGFKTIAESLADDYLLGNLPAKLGYQVVLSSYIVNHEIGEESVKDYWLRQVRWYRCIRVERFWGYLGIIFTQGTVISILILIVSGFSFTGIILSLVLLILRLYTAYFVGLKILQDPTAEKYLGLVFITDLLRFVIWLTALFGNTIEWRGKKFKLIKGGKLQPLSY